MDSRVVIWILIISSVQAQYDANGAAAGKATTYGPLLRVEGEVHAEKAEEQKLGGLNPTDVYGEVPVERPLPSSVGSVPPSPKSPKVVDSSEESKESVTQASADSAPGYGPEASSTTEKKHDAEDQGLFSTGIHGMDITTVESTQETTAGSAAITGATSNAGGASVSSEHNSGYDVQAQGVDTTTNTAAPATTTTSELEKSTAGGTEESTRKTATTPPPTPKPEENTTPEPKSLAVATPEVNPKSEETTTAAANQTAETENPEEFKLSAEQPSSKSAEAETVQDALNIVSTTETAAASNVSESNPKPAAENQASAGNGGYDSPVPATIAASETTPVETTGSPVSSAAPEGTPAAPENSESPTTPTGPEPTQETTGSPSAAAEYDFGSSPAPPQGTPEASSSEVNTLPPAAEPAAPGFSTPSPAPYGDDAPASTASPATETSSAPSTEAETTAETTVTTIEPSEAPNAEVTQASAEATKTPEGGYDSAPSSSPAPAETSPAAEPTTTSEPAEITEAPETSTLSAASAETTAASGSSETTESSNPSTESVSSDSSSGTTKEEDAGAAPGLNPKSSTTSAPGYDVPAVSSPASVAPAVIGEPSTPTEEKENPTSSYDNDSKPSEAPAPTTEAPSVTPAASNGYEQSNAGSSNSQPASPAANSHSATPAGSGTGQAESGYQSNQPESVAESHASFGSHPEPAPALESTSSAAPAEPSPATTASPKRWKISQGFKKPVDGQTGAKSYDDPNRVTEPVHVLEPSGYGVNDQSPVYSPPTRVISASEAVGYDGVPTGAQRDTKVEKATARVDVHPRHSSMKRKWKPFEMDCASEVDDRGTELCSEWAKGGLCEAHKATMFLFCRKTCLCVGPPSSAESLEVRRGRRHPRFFRFQL
ncbi:unnamed protein product [Bursaphelenchus xylophilus]|uniref:(pine wood nematode) hypothetical protein n=1 Tax=Bursaphelenchus xylophilus TaxID=6326 RepID=A0A7I8WQC8_BURXY|nr:unnamed protein product [Bursaphelenchus xylophilus]CAG9096069.1 unnamed protein product [Bursaphelenchus xylophilus]